MTTELQEALDAAGAAALVSKQIDSVLLEYQRRYAPLLTATPSVKWGSPVYYFNKRSSLPSGGNVVDGGSRPVTTSTYAQENFTIKLFQAVGAVTGYAQAVTANLVGDLRAREIEGTIRSLSWSIENEMVWGANAATVNGPYPEFDGLDVICASFSSASSGGPGQGIGGGGIDNYGGARTWGAPQFSPWTDGVAQNAVNAGGNYLSLGLLDNVIDMVEQNVSEDVQNAMWQFVMSPTAVSRLAQLLYNTFRVVDQVEVDPGMFVPSYRGIPIIKTSFLSPRTNKMGTVTASTATTTGSIAASTYCNYAVAPVIDRFGEIQASSQVQEETGSGGDTNTVTLAFSTPAVTDEGLQPLFYKVYANYSLSSTVPANTSMTLLGFVDAFYLDSAGAIHPTTHIIDTGTALLPYDGTHAQATALAPAAYIYGNANLNPLTSNGEQSIFLMSRNSDYIVRPYVREMAAIQVYPTTSSPDSLPFAFQSECCLAVRAPKYIGRLANVIGAIDQTAGNGVVPTNSAYTPHFVVD